MISQNVTDNIPSLSYCNGRENNYLHVAASVKKRTVPLTHVSMRSNNSTKMNL